MNKNNIFIPSLEKGMGPIILFISTIISLFLGCIITAIFLFLEYFFGFEYFGIYTPFNALYALSAWLLILIYPTVKAVRKLSTLYYVDENENVVNYYINVDAITDFKDLAGGAMVGMLIDRIIGHGATGLIASHGIVKAIKSIVCNTNKEFVLHNIENKNIYSVKKVYKKEENFRLDTLYRNSSEVDNTTPIRMLPRTLGYTSLVTSIFLVINILFMSVAIGNNAEIKKTSSDVKVHLDEQLIPYGYENKSDKLMVFKRNKYNIDSTVLLDYNYAGKLVKTEVNIYWDYSENPELILNEIKTIYDILELDFDEAVYSEKLTLLQSKKTGYHIDKQKEYSIYLTPSSGKINLNIH